jgi:ribosomal protein S18 acetylase RimI-like enzyme
MRIQYDLLEGLYFDNKIIEDGYEIYKSKTISDNFWNIAVLNGECVLNDKSVLAKIERQFNIIDRQPCIYIPRIINKYADYKDYLVDNGYKVNDVDAYMAFVSDNINVEIKNNIKIVQTIEQFNDFMEVMESAYGGEITEENPYAGSITNEYYEAIRKSLGNSKFSHLILYKDKKPVSVATLCYENGYGVINNVGTKKEYQNLGLGKQIMKYCVNTFNELGGGTLFLFTEYGSKNEQWYEKQGFKTLFVNEQYIKQ